MPNKKVNLTREKILEALSVHPLSMLKASQYLGVTYTSFVRYARSENLYSPNPGGKGVSKKWIEKKDLSYYLVEGKFCNTSRLKERLYAEGLKTEQCEECGINPIWNGKILVMHLDHIDGDSSNNLLENLRILCPNCHSQTETYCRGQRKKNK